MHGTSSLCGCFTRQSRKLKGRTDGKSGSTFIYFTIFWIIVSRKLCRFKGKLCLLSFIFLAISFMTLDNICLLLRPWRSFRPSQHRRLNVICLGSLLFSTILSSVPHFYMRRVTFHFVLLWVSILRHFLPVLALTLTLSQDLQGWPGVYGSLNNKAAGCQGEAENGQTGSAASPLTVRPVCLHRHSTVQQQIQRSHDLHSHSLQDEFNTTWSLECNQFRLLYVWLCIMWFLWACTGYYRTMHCMSKVVLA